MKHFNSAFIPIIIGIFRLPVNPAIETNTFTPLIQLRATSKPNPHVFGRKAKYAEKTHTGRQTWSSWVGFELSCCWATVLATASPCHPHTTMSCKGLRPNKEKQIKTMVYLLGKIKLQTRAKIQWILLDWTCCFTDSQSIFPKFCKDIIWFEKAS